MFVDASVIVAILNKEPGWEELEKQLSAASKPVYVSPLVRFEAVQGLARAAAENIKKNTKPTPGMLAHARGLVEDFAAEVAAKDIMISVDIGNRAIDASMNYGKAVGHKADLNFGDCFAYACAKAHRLSLLYKGNDFSLTDLA
ncbi:type II toxin-antitoxin system VapC family toxin [Mesorhizobium sp. P16.1]|uniref:type II toxin-antitoxin system VapC family toxin n=1 Tax=unclassified Mesorhizobium TaxID=325217 RepID=UPI0021A478AB|nr:MULTISPECIES: type II toxin-antitoxin system VapC family toxin [unclassified Mesorhizobium]MCT2580907.1 type II toxin-antitoxin system VapC family toxin [Mesorhizobium sp. P13.3]MDF3169954.1 type II toxin-antitoxin system VapC family toxin [Mesorhizobium sp. P16.1]MDF3181420.1 type II toxin-antitoxin system VapC family toxin [Mesorhizobium sp. P17.1]MDF3186913.1 type II toxin-antitoxin system VapC family toxin [Mesorhizobium sp. ICCV3110.1]